VGNPKCREIMNAKKISVIIGSVLLCLGVGFGSGWLVHGSLHTATTDDLRDRIGNITELADAEGRRADELAIRVGELEETDRRREELIAERNRLLARAEAERNRLLEYYNRRAEEIQREQEESNRRTKKAIERIRNRLVDPRY
jgi:hypothetical protein